MSKFEINYPGYVLYERGRTHADFFKMYLSLDTREAQIAADERQEQERLDAKRAAEKAEDETEGADNPWVVRKNSKDASGLQKEKKSKEAIERDKEQEVWEGIAKKDKETRARVSYPVFDHNQAVEFFSRIGMGDNDDRERLGRVYSRLVETGTVYRSLARPKSLAPLEALAHKQPHMKEVVHFVIEQLKLAQISRKPVRLQPMLLVGEPGVGKTYFAQALAAALATTISIQQLDSDLTASLLLGSDRKWSNSQHGVLFDQLVLGKHANPIMVLDEIDKAQRMTGYGSPVGGMYSVLEPLSARRVRDIALMFEFDASQVTWLATANDATMLESALRSRFREFHIQPPDALECLVLAEEVMRAAIDSVNVKGFKTDVSIKRYLAHLPARQIWQLTLDAMAKAIAHKRKHLLIEDLPAWLFEPLGGTPNVQPNRMH